MNKYLAYFLIVATVCFTVITLKQHRNEFILQKMKANCNKAEVPDKEEWWF